MVQIQKITTAGEALNHAIKLFEEYANELNENLCFQSFDEELQNPLYKYGVEAKGALLICYVHQKPVGCVALQNLGNNVCEMKRLYVQAHYRKQKIGDFLVQQILIEAQLLGFTTMKLDTLVRLQAAIELYKKYGFEETTAYYENPLPEVVYMEKRL